MFKGTQFWLLGLILLSLTACTAPDINDWPPAPIEASDDVIQQYVDRYAHKESSPRVYTDIELQALQILQQRTRYHEGLPVLEMSDQTETPKSSAKERSRAEVNAIKKRVYRRYESAHDRRHKLKSRYGL